MRFIVMAAALSLALSSAALAQNASGGGGDSPQNKGSTGWTGAHPETGGATVEPAKPSSETTGQGVQIHDQDAAKTQPWVATGEDLKGPPAQFPPSKTPE